VATPTPVFFYNPSPDGRIVLSLRAGAASIVLEATFLEQEGIALDVEDKRMTRLVCGHQMEPIGLGQENHAGGKAKALCSFSSVSSPLLSLL
jgi:hypothetical protein